ncbi:MAG: hypothetical protein H6573_15535 [Lewinellaceae bacterium]|nr:hypothetical protein [Lewinellaceae bacterium]
MEKYKMNPKSKLPWSRLKSLTLTGGPKKIYRFLQKHKGAGCSKTPGSFFLNTHIF